MKKGLGILLFILLLLGSGGCSKDSFFGEPSISEPEAKVLTITDGTILTSSSEIPLSLAVPTDIKKKEITEPYVLSASIQTPDGTEVATVTLDRIEPTTGPLPSLVPPPLSPGTYTLVLTLKKGQTQAYQTRVTFFVEEGSYELERISFFPPSVLPLSTAIMRVDLRVPSSADPWIRWTIQGRAVQEKLFSQGGSELRWTSPGKEGLYPVRVELFPHPPREGATYTFSSPVYLTSQLVVSSMVGLKDSDLQPESAHWSLFHFMGNLRDSGYRKNKAEYGMGHLKEIGSPQIALKGTVFGYYLDGKSGFVTEQLLIPFEEESPLTNFTLRFRVQPEEPVEGRTWFETKEKNGNFHLKIRTTSEKRMEAVIKLGSGNMTILSRGSIEKEQAKLVELSCSLTGNVFQGKWSMEGSVEEPAQQLELTADEIASVGKEGVSWIGFGEEGNGLVGVLDEFGIQIEKASSRLSESKTNIPIQTEGRVEQVDSIYILSPGSSLYCGPVELASVPKEISLVMEPLDTVNMEIRFLGKEKEVPWAVLSGKEGRWNISAEGKEFPLSPPVGDTLKFLVQKQKEAITITWNEVAVSVTGSRVESEQFFLQLYHASDAVHPLKIRGIRILEQN